MSPKTINDLGTCFDTNFLATWQGMSEKLRVVRSDPCLLPIDQDSFFFVNDVVMDHAWQGYLVCFGTISMKYDLAILQKLVGDGQPFSTTNRSRTRRSRIGSGRLQAKQSERLWSSTFSETSQCPGEL